MQPLQNSSVKIKKNPRNSINKEKSFVCGGCQAAYGSYPALYLHIKRKHNGIRPPNTKTIKMVNSQQRDKVHTGRPQKPSLDVDAVSESKMYIEEIQSEFLGFLGENLKIVSILDSKPKLQNVFEQIAKTPNPSNDEALNEFIDKVIDLSSEMQKTEAESIEVNIDFDAFSELDKTDRLKILCWFLVWLGKNIVKTEALGDLTLVFSKVWASIRQKLEIQDLDNKLVWNGVMKTCEGCLSRLVWFGNQKELLYEFISKACHLIGKIFE